MPLPSRLTATPLPALLLLLPFLPPSPVPGDEAPKSPADRAGKAAAAARVLTEFHQKSPAPSKRALRVVYFTPADVAPPEGWKPRIERIVEDIRDYFAREMKRNGLAARPIPLPLDDAGKPVLYLVKGRLPRADYGDRSGSAIRDEAALVLKKEGIDANQEALLIFCNLKVVKGLGISGSSPYYGGGSARSGTAWVSDAPWLDPKNLPEKKVMIQDAQYGRISMGKYNTVFLGGTAHELGHGLGLPHDRETGDEKPLGTSLMGSGNQTYGDEQRGEGKGSFLAFADALRLASHPLFSGSVKGLNAKTTSRFDRLAVEPGRGAEEKTFTVRGVVTSSLPCYAVVAYLDPTGGSDYDARTCTAVPAADGSFTLRCTDLDPAKRAQLRLVACLANGATHTTSFGYTVTAKGLPVLDDLRIDLLLGPAFAAWRKGDRKAFEAATRAALKGLPADDAVRRWAETLALTLGGPSEPAPAAVDAGKKSVLLSRCKATESKVGYGEPARDHFPGEGKYLSVRGERHAHGFYAHSPARHAFDLGGKWAKLTGTAGVQDGGYGKVVFVIKADGAEVWRSKLVPAEQVVPFDVSVEGKRVLELIVEDGGDGKASDWGVWLSPKLSR